MLRFKRNTGEFRRGHARLAALWLIAFVSAGLWALLGGGGGRVAPVRAPVVEASAAGSGVKAVPIESVRAGQRVWAYDAARGRWEPREIVRTLTHAYAGEVVTIRVAGREVEATANHPFWVESGEGLAGRPQSADVPEAERAEIAAAGRSGRWVDAGHLRLDDVLVMRDGHRSAIESLRSRPAELAVYNLHVAGLHSYAVGPDAVAVHNTGETCPPITYMIDDGVRRAKAAQLRGMEEISASVGGGPSKKLPIESLRSPKPEITLSNQREIDAWKSINEGMDITPDLFPDISVRPGSGGTPIKAVKAPPIP